MICFFLMVWIHDIGYDIYMTYYTPRSRGAGLGFVFIYSVFFILPSFFAVIFAPLRWGVMIVAAVMGALFYLWFGSNPLRVILMALSSLLPYTILFVMNVWLEKRIK